MRAALHARSSHGTARSSMATHRRQRGSFWRARLARARLRNWEHDPRREHWELRAILAVDRAAEGHQCAGIARERNPARAYRQDRPGISYGLPSGADTRSYDPLRWCSGIDQDPREPRLASQSP